MSSKHTFHVWTREGGVRTFDSRKFTFEIPTNGWLVIYRLIINGERASDPYLCYSPSAVEMVEVPEEWGA